MKCYALVYIDLLMMFFFLIHFRRFVWNFFRLENEHLNNCGQFRAVRDISIAPIDTNDQALLEAMMDEEDGVTNRRHVEKQKLLTRYSIFIYVFLYLSVQESSSRK